MIVMEFAAGGTLFDLIEASKVKMEISNIYTSMNSVFSGVTALKLQYLV